MAVLITSTAVCEFLQIKPNYLYQLNFRKQLIPVEKQGNKLLYSVEDVDAYVAKRAAKNS